MGNINNEQTTTVVEATKLVRLSYLQTVAATDDAAALSRIAGETDSDRSNFSSSDPGSPGFLGIGGEGASSVTQSFTDTGWSISRTWLETWWDKVRWAIGLREIGIYSYDYTESAEIVSIPFQSPRPVAKVSLIVDEQIPSSFPQSQRWIHYFVSGDNAKTWNRINPREHPTLFAGEGGQPIPRIINYNADFASEDSNEEKFITTEDEVTDIRFRAVILRPGGEQFKGITPALKSYKMMIYPKEGLI